VVSRIRRVARFGINEDGDRALSLEQRASRRIRSSLAIDQTMLRRAMVLSSSSRTCVSSGLQSEMSCERGMRDRMPVDRLMKRFRRNVCAAPLPPSAVAITFCEAERNSIVGTLPKSSSLTRVSRISKKDT
jgi:hypothetical protein